MIQVIQAALAADVPVLLWGAPGTGKTATIRSLAEKENAHLEVLIGSTLDPTDLGYQVPSPDGRELRHVPPAWALRLQEALGRGQVAWLLLDELSCAPPAVQAALLRLVHERQVGDCDLRGVRILAAANPTEQGAGAMDLPPAQANRWLHIQWQLEANDWCRGVLHGWGKSKISAAEARMRQLVSAYVRVVPSALLDCPDDPEKASGAWPSPRSWESLARALGSLTTDPQKATAAALSDAGAAIARGLVGTGAAGEFTSWVSSAELPDPEEILSGRAQLPARADLQHAVLEAVAVAATDPEHRDGRERWSKAWELLAGVRADVRLGAAKLLLDRRPESFPLTEHVESIAASIREAQRELEAAAEEIQED